MKARRDVVRSLITFGAGWFLGARAKTSWASGGAVCPPLPEETSGPFPADGSQQGYARQTGVPDILAAPGIVREDIRASFGTSAAVAAGVPLRLELTLLDRRRGCGTLAECGVYLWNCNRDGDYSLYGRGIEHENYLRGVQFSDRDGRVAFQTIFPACYSGRYPHLHLEVFRQNARVLDAGARILTTQLTAPAEVCTRVYEGAAGYSRSAAQFQGLSPGDDMVFASSSPGELALQTLLVTGELQTGFTGRATLGIRV